MKTLNKRSGFTLIEMAVVLVIIGLILGAVSIGKDLQRSAEYQKIKQKFIDQWAQAYNQYYNKYGVALGDAQVSPTGAINGNSSIGVRDSFLNKGTGNYASGVTVPPRICEGNSNDTEPTGRTADSTSRGLHGFFDKAGIRMPPGRSEGREDRFVYLDSNGNPQEIQVCFQWNPPESPSGSGNVMVVIGLTPDLARYIDQMIDGKPDSREGMFREQSTTNATDGVAGVEWDNVNTSSFGTADQRNLDEDQVAVVTAHYKMNQ